MLSHVTQSFQKPILSVSTMWERDHYIRQRLRFGLKIISGGIAQMRYWELNPPYIRIRNVFTLSTNDPS